MKYDGKFFIDNGFPPGPWMGQMIAGAKDLDDAGLDQKTILAEAQTIYNKSKPAPTIPLQTPALIYYNIDGGDDELEQENIDAVVRHMDELVKTPTIMKAVVMPDACPAGSALGTIPVGGVVIAKNAVHPGMHSADICCSMFATVLEGEHTVGEILDSAMKLSHFGAGGRTDFQAPTRRLQERLDEVLERAEANQFLKSEHLIKAMTEHHGTQGDGNHFFYVGRRQSDGGITMVTHHGSRKPGALLYKAGMKTAEKFRQVLSPATAKHNAWIPMDTDEGVEYWDALQIIREWTKLNHASIHAAVEQDIGGEERDSFWNEHNFVFKRDDDLYYHAKGATPIFGDHAFDADPDGRTLIPLNMAEPILIATGENAGKTGAGFAPHGAGRNYSRTKYKKLNSDKTDQEMMDEQVGHLDVRFYCGTPDPSELPGAYKNADSVRAQIEKYKLATIIDQINPLGSIMAGDQQIDWKKLRAEKRDKKIGIRRSERRDLKKEVHNEMKRIR